MTRLFLPAAIQLGLRASERKIVAGWFARTPLANEYGGAGARAALGAFVEHVSSVTRAMLGPGGYWPRVGTAGKLATIISALTDAAGGESLPRGLATAWPGAATGERA